MSTTFGHVVLIPWKTIRGTENAAGLSRRLADEPFRKFSGVPIYPLTGRGFGALPMMPPVLLPR